MTSNHDECSDMHTDKIGQSDAVYRCETMSASQNQPKLASAPADELGLGLWLVSACANSPSALGVPDLSAASHSLAFFS